MRTRRSRTRVLAAVAAAVLAAGGCTATPGVTPSGSVPVTASSAPASVDAGQLDLVPLLGGFKDFWHPDGDTPFSGTVVDGDVLTRNDETAAWINDNATDAQRFAALQAAAYDVTGIGYDLSIVVAPGLGSVLGPLYVRGRRAGLLPLTSALVNSETGSSGGLPAGLDAAKETFGYPRPFLPAVAGGTPCVGGGDASALVPLRTGKTYARADGGLDIQAVPDTTDDSRQYADADIPLSAGYTALCTSGSFPSGHTATAYEAGITLATLLPELGPEILARSSENSNDRIVLGLHYPLDVMGGRIVGEAEIAARWSDAAYRQDVLEPARAELVAYLQDSCGGALAACIARSEGYHDDPYGGRSVPGGTDQVVTDRASAVAVYTERLAYGFDAAGTAPPAATSVVPSGAENLLLTTFPGLDDEQRRSVLRQTLLPPGYPLDQPDGSWQRLDLAAAMSATVRVNADRTVSVLGVGGAASTSGP